MTTHLTQTLRGMVLPEGYNQAALTQAADAIQRLWKERDQLREDLEFVERWAVHHGSKPSTTPEEVLSVIQHYPAIKAITKGYKDGKVPETRDPWAEADQLRAEVEALRRGEFICQKCGLRKDADAGPVPF